MIRRITTFRSISTTAFTSFSSIGITLNKDRKFTNVYVHCYAGVSRSSAVVCAYLMWKYRWGIGKCLAFVRVKRIVAQPN